jgi:transposase InsO family protein
MIHSLHVSYKHIFPFSLSFPFLSRPKFQRASWPQSYTPFEVLNIDYVGPFPDDGHVLVIICAFTRWVELYWCQDATASWACDCLLQHFSFIRSDRGSHSANDLIKEFLDRIGTPHNLTLAYSKQENALVERVNKEVNRHLRAFSFESIDLASYRSFSMPNVLTTHPRQIHVNRGGICGHVNAYTPTYAFTTYSV